MPFHSTATPVLLNSFLNRKPILWVGAGLSVAAGHPSTNDLVKAMVLAADSPIDPALPFEAVADAFIKAMSAGDLEDLLEAQLGRALEPTAAHRAIARAAGEGRFAAIVTTNYDDLLEASLRDAKVPFRTQILEGNATLQPDGKLLLLKVHGSRHAWKDVILSGASYAAFDRAHPFLEKQLHVDLRRHSLLFVGCSMQDQRIVTWLDALDDSAIRRLKSWRTLIAEKSWDAAVAAHSSLERSTLKPLFLSSHQHLQQLWLDAVPEVAPVGELVLDLTVTPGGLEAAWNDAVLVSSLIEKPDED